MKRIDLPRATIGRIPIYVRYLKDLQKNEPQTENISATALARALGLGEVQVRKDLSALCGAGRPKTGYRIDTLFDRFLPFSAPIKTQALFLSGRGSLAGRFLTTAALPNTVLIFSPGLIRLCLSRQKVTAAR